MSELEHLLLTAGHDLATLTLPLTLDVANGTEAYTTLRGEPQTLKPADMHIRDGEGVISSIIYGPDQRTALSPATTSALFTVYTPPGVAPGAVEAHLQALETNARLISPAAETLALETLSAAPSPGSQA